jgi:hypothetical protein
MLILLATLILSAGNRQLPRTPRLLGGSARHAGAASAAAATAVTAAAVAAPLAMWGNRGLGRFAKPRTDPPRPLL